VDIRKILDSVTSSPLQSRIRELLRQSQDHQTELSRIADELESIHEQLKAMKAKNSPEEPPIKGEQGSA
jgi:peptidoglycan hydrolase CwlO-like protein